MQPEYTPPRDAGAPIAPSRFTAAGPEAERRERPEARNHAALVGYFVLGISVLLAVAVLLLLPKLIARPTPSMPATPVVSTPDKPAPAPAPITDPILGPEQQASARLDAQNALGAVLQLSDSLAARKADEWAHENYQKASAEVALGETAYREQRYPAALRSYAEATRQFEAIAQQIPEVVTTYIEEGEREILSGHSVAAQQAFERALALAPDDERAQEGRKRASVLDRVVALIAEAQGYERMKEMERARSAYREALTLDAGASEASQAIQRIDRARAEKDYARAMSAGYKALEAQQFDNARSSFEQASKLKPDAAEARNALHQTALRSSAARIEQALRAAANHERAERWNEAAGQYRAALAVDKSLDAANSGLQRASTRTALDMELEKTLAQTARLSEDGVYRQAQTLLDRARATTGAGPRLKRQIERLAAAISYARTPVAVMLVSDGLTAVAVQRVGSFAPFAQHPLTLLAGRYTATGKRDGYRDVRVEFTIDPAAPPPPITVKCTEPIKF